ncbi:hypothetical protein [Candidatus Enterovibrio escicola]|uniref:hypothetical protein n=1 Tax=Candidatus Enterovibrio escicola TaxID=1927127 RepID=UPI001237F66B|nr:hypothetical protein [Candidatus Enterovibrio escacola]
MDDNEILSILLNQLRRKIQQVNTDEAYDTRACQPRTEEQRNNARYSTLKQRGVLGGRAS